MVLTEGYLKNNQDLWGLRVGIDARCGPFLYRIIFSFVFFSGFFFKHNYHVARVKNAQLASIQTWINKLFNMTVLPIFVFDGPSRPVRKRGKLVHGNPHWLEEDFKVMLTAYGFQYHTVHSH